MRLEKQARGQGTSAAGIWVGGLLALGAASAAAWLRLGLPLPACRLREATGLPCATCGTTRMVEALLAGDLAGAFAWNPLVFSVLTAVATWSAYSAARFAFGLPGFRLSLRRRERIGVGVAAASLFFAGWAYVILYDI